MEYYGIDIFLITKIYGGNEQGHEHGDGDGYEDGDGNGHGHNEYGLRELVEF